MGINNAPNVFTDLYKLYKPDWEKDKQCAELLYNGTLKCLGQLQKILITQKPHFKNVALFLTTCESSLFLDRDDKKLYERMKMFINEQLDFDGEAIPIVMNLITLDNLQFIATFNDDMAKTLEKGMLDDIDSWLRGEQG